MSFIAKSLLIVTLLFSITNKIMAQTPWQDLTSVEDVYEAYPQRMEIMLDQFNLDYPGLEKVKTAANRGDIVAACQHLLAYYAISTNAQHLRQGATGPN